MSKGILSTRRCTNAESKLRKARFKYQKVDFNNLVKLIQIQTISLSGSKKQVLKLLVREMTFKMLVTPKIKIPM